MTLHHAELTLGLTGGFKIWNAWLSQCNDYWHMNPARAWESFGRGSGEVVTLGTLFYLADEADPDWWEDVAEASEQQSTSETKEEKPNGNDQEPPKSNETASATPKPQQQWRAAIPLINVSTWDDVPVPPQEWAVPDRIPQRCAALFSGEGAAGKSLIQLHASVAHVLHREWLGTTPAQGPAIFIDAEDEINVIHKRLADILRHYGARFADVKDNLHLVSLAGMDAVLGAFNRRSGRVTPTNLYERLLEMAGDLKPKMIGIASAADVFAGNELDRSQVKQFVALLTKLAMVANGAVTLISHPSLTGITTGTGLSGSTQWHNAVRARFYLKGVNQQADEQPDTDLREIVFKKNNYGPITASIPLRYTNGLFLPITGTTLDAAARSEQAKEVFITILGRFNNESRNTSPNKGSGYAPALFAKEQEARSARVSKEELAEAMRTLLREKKVIQQTYGKPSHPHHRLAVNPYSERPDDEPF